MIMSASESSVVMETAVTMEDHTDVAMAKKPEVQDSDRAPSPDQPRRRTLGRRSQRGKRRAAVEKRRGLGEKRRGQRLKRRGQEEKKEGVTVKRTWSGGKRRWDKKHYCVFCRRPQVKIARHLLRKHADEQEVVSASALPPGSKQRHLLLEHLRCRGNYLHNIEVIRQGSGEIIPWRQPSEEVDARNYLPCPLCLGFFLRADLWKHQVSCRKKLAINPSKEAAASSETDPQNSESTGRSGCDAADSSVDIDPPGDRHGDEDRRSGSGSKRALTSEPGSDQNLTPDSTENRPRKRTRVQAAASRLLPISSGASESCSEILHRMNQDNVSYEVKSDWLICKYGNKLMGNQDGSQRRYDYVSQKLRELGRLLLAAKSLDPAVQNLQDLLSPGRLSLALSAARKASGFRWSRPPLAVKTTLKTVCEIAIGENLEDGDWEAAAKTTDFYHMLGREWDNLGLQNPGPVPATSEGTKVKKHPVQSRNDKDLRPDGLSKNGTRPLSSVLPPDSRLQNPVSVPAAPRKVRRRPWSSAEKEAIWRQLGVHVLVQSVPGKEVCQRCLDLEPVLRGRHWKDIKNQIHNQIQSQKKQQFHAQMDLEENQDQQDHIQNQSQKKQPVQYQTEMDPQGKDHQNQKKQLYPSQMDQHQQDNGQNQKRPPYHIQMDHQVQDGIQNQKKQHEHTQLDHQNHQNHQDHQNHQNHQNHHDHQDHQDHSQVLKKQLYHNRLDHQDHQDHSQVLKKQLYHNRLDHQNHQDHQVLKKQLYQMDQQTLDRDTSVLTLSPYGPDGPLRAPGLPLLERDPTIAPYPLLHRAPGPHMDQLLSRPDWTEEALAQNYPIGRSLGRNLLQEIPPGGPAPDPHSGHVHF